MTKQNQTPPAQLVRALDSVAKHYMTLAHAACEAGDPFEVTRWTKLYMRTQGEMSRLIQRYQLTHTDAYSSGEY